MTPTIHVYSISPGFGCVFFFEAGSTPLAYAAVERGERGEGENELGFAGAAGRPAVLIRSGALRAVGWHPTARGSRLAPRAKRAGAESAPAKWARPESAWLGLISYGPNSFNIIEK